MLLFRGQPKFSLRILGKTRNIGQSIYHIFIFILLLAIFLLRLIAIDPFSYQHIAFIGMFIYAILQTLAIIVLIVIFIFLDRQIFPKQHSRSFDEIEAEEERIYYQKIGKPVPKSAEKNDSDKPSNSFSWRRGFVLHFGSTAGWLVALWYYDDPNFNLPSAIITFFICGVISWIIMLIAFIKSS